MMTENISAQLDAILLKLIDVQRENAELKAELKALRNENDIKHRKLIGEVVSLKEQMRSESQPLVKKSMRNAKVLPRSPFSSLLDFEVFEDNLKKSTEMAQQLEDEILPLAIHSPSKFLRGVWQRILDDELAKQFSWRGTSLKRAVRTLYLTDAIRSAYSRKFSCSDKEFEMITIKWFQTANDRTKKKCQDPLAEVF